MQQVLSAYEKLGLRYMDHRSQLRSDTYVRLLMQNIPKGSLVLDVGCGMGVPVDDILVKQGYLVQGIDLSPTLIREARRLVPGAEYAVRDMQTLKPGEYSVQAVICLYSLFHTPRSTHPVILKTFASFLPPRGQLLLSMGDIPFEGEHEMYGVRSYSSQWGVARNTAMVVDAGFMILRNEIAVSGGERHQMIIATKK